MPPLFRFCLFTLICGGGLPLSAGNFSRHVPAGGFLYVEFRDAPDGLRRSRQTPVYEKLKDFDWKALLIHSYQVGRSRTSEGGPEAVTPENLHRGLGELETTLMELGNYVAGDIALSLGNFQNAAMIFRENNTLRAGFGHTGDFQFNIEEVSEEQLDEMNLRIKEEARLDRLEIASLLNELRMFIDVKQAEELEEELLRRAEELVSGQADQKSTVTRTPAGTHTLYSLGSGEEDAAGLYWAIENDVLVIAFSEISLRSSLADLQKPLENSLADHPAFRDSVGSIGPHDSLTYFNLSALDPLIRVWMSGQEKEAPGLNPALGNLPTGEKVLDWMELDAVLPYVVGLRLDREGVHTRGRYGFSRETPLARILLGPVGGTVDIPGFLHRDFNQFSVFNWHIGTFWKQLEKELMTLVPQAAGGMGFGRMLVAGQIGFDPLLQFLDHMEGEVLLVQQMDSEVTRKVVEAARKDNPAEIMKVQMEHPTSGQNYLIGMKMKNGEAVREALRRLMNRFHPRGAPEPEVHSHVEVYFPVPADFQGGKFRSLVSYSFLEDYFLIAFGNVQLLKDAITASQDPEQQLLNAEIRTLLSGISPENPSGMEYSNSRQTKEAIQMMQTSMSLLAGSDEASELPDLTVLAEMFRQTLTVTVKKGWVIESKGLAEFPPGP